MKKAIVLFFVIILLANISVANDFYDNGEVEMDLSISGGIKINPDSDNYRIDYVKANLLFYPVETWRQTIISSDIEPEAQITENSVNFEWDDIEKMELNFKTDYTIKTNEQIKKMEKKNDFPIKDLSEEYIQHTKPTENIDSDDKEIIKLASGLAEGEDDLFIVTNKLASWVEDNIRYDLTTLTEKASQKASWVLLNRFGVCDELTSLFIAMAKSLGIPARFISGVAYTNWNNLNNWGSHAWAEVYFPGYGWVPFDITYRQFGFIDLSHIKLKESLDSGEPSARYEWKGYKVSVEPQELNINVDLISKKEKIEHLISLRTNIFEENIGFGSYNLVEAEVKNLKDYYMATELYLSKSSEVELADENKKYIVLKPNEKKKIYWLIRVKKDLDERYAYTFPVGVNSPRNSSSIIFFSCSSDDIIYSRSEMEKILKQREKETEKVYSKKIELGCNAEKEEYYLDEQIIIKCYTKNIGNTMLSNLNLCLKEECHSFDLGISQSVEKNFSIIQSDLGKKEDIITIENNDVFKLARVDYSVTDRPKIEITALEYPDDVSYNDEFNVEFTLVKASKSTPNDVVVEFKGKGFSRTWEIASLDKEQKFVLNLQGRDLNVNKNSFNIIVNYKDKEDNRYAAREDFYINLSKVNFIQRIIIFFRNIFYRKY